MGKHPRSGHRHCLPTQGETHAAQSALQEPHLRTADVPLGARSPPRERLRGPWTRGAHGHTCTPPLLSPARSQDPGQNTDPSAGPSGTPRALEPGQDPAGPHLALTANGQGRPLPPGCGLGSLALHPPGPPHQAPLGQGSWVPQAGLPGALWGHRRPACPKPRPTAAACPPDTTQPAQTACRRAPGACHQLGARAPRKAHATAPPPAPEGPPGPMGPSPLRATPMHTQASLTPAPASPRETH